MDLIAMLAFNSLRQAKITCQSGWLARNLAVANPMPAFAPVIMAVLIVHSVQLNNAQSSVQEFPDGEAKPRARSELEQWPIGREAGCGQRESRSRPPNRQRPSAGQRGGATGRRK